MKTSHRFFFPTIGSRVRVIGTKAVGTIESFENYKLSSEPELFAKIRYKNRLTRYSKVSDFGVILPKSLHFLYPLLDGKKSGREFAKCLYEKAVTRLEKWFESFFCSDLDRILIGICILIAATLIIAFTLK